MASWMKNKPKKGWTIKNSRPDEIVGNPLKYYTDEEVEKYARSSAMRRAQEKIANRILELLNLPENSSLLDIGCGPGFTTNVYKNANLKTTCLDVTPKMVEKAKANGFDAHLGDMRDIQKIFPNKKFDSVVSASALQWLKSKEDIEQVAKGIHSVLDKRSPMIIQFYPKSEQELKQTAKTFVDNGFEGEIIIDWPEIPKNKTFYLVMKKT